MERAQPAGITRRKVLERGGIGAAVIAGGLGPWNSIARAADQARDPVRIGMLVTLSGPLASVGLELQRGFVVYVKQNRSRLGGRKVQFFVEDDNGDPATAIQKSQKLIREDRVDFVTGITPSNVAIAIRDLYHSAKMPLIISNAAANEVTREKGSPYIFRSAYTNGQIGAAMARWFYRNIAASEVVTAGSNYSAGQEIVRGFSDAFKALGGSIKSQIFPPFGTVTDYQPYLADIQQAKPKAVYAFFPAAEALRFVRQYSQFGLKRDIPLHGSFITDPQSVLNAQGGAALGVGTNAPWAIELDSVENRRFIEAYRRQFGQIAPSSFAATSHNAAQMVDLALRKIKGRVEDKQAFVAALKNVGSFRSPAGVIRIDPNTQNPVRPWYLRQARLENGVWENKLLSSLGVYGDPWKK